MKYASAVLAVACLLSAVNAQWLEKTIYLPDSAGGVLYPQAAACDPAGTRVYVGGESRGVAVLDAATGRRLYRIETGPDVPAVLHIPVRNKVYAPSRAADTVYVADGTTGHVSSKLQVGRSPTALACLPTGDRVYVACAGTWGDPDSSVYEIDCAADSVRAVFAVGQCPTALVYNPVNGFLYSANANSNTVSAIDCLGGSGTIEIPVGGGPVALACNTVNNKVYCANWDDATVSVIDGTDNQVKATVPTGQTPLALCCDSAFNKVFCADHDGMSVTVIDGAGNQVITSIPLDDSPLQLGLDPDSNRVYCLTEGYSSLVTISAQSNQVVGSMELGEEPGAMCFVRQARCVHVADASQAVVAVVVSDSDKIRTWTRLGIEPGLLVANQSGTKLYAFGGTYPYDSVNASAIDPQHCTVTKCFELESDGPPGLGCFDSADSKLYYVGFGAKVGIIDTKGDSVRGHVTMPDDVYGLAYAPAFGRVYAGGGYFDGFIAAIDGVGDTLVKSLAIPGGGGVRGFCHDPKHGTVYGFGNQRAVFTVVDCRADTIAGQFPGGQRCGEAMYNPISDKVYTNDLDGGVMLVIDAATYTILAQIDIGGGAGEVTLNTTNNKVYSTGLYVLGIVDGAGDSLIAKLTPSPYLRDLAYDPNHNIMYCDHDSGDMNAVALLGGATDSVIGNILLPGAVSDMTAVPQADRVFVADDYNSCIYVIRTSPPAVTEAASAGVRRAARRATVVRGVLFLNAPGTRSGLSDDPVMSRAELLNIAGRKVMDLRGGANDVRALAPGVYFAREEPQANSLKPQAATVRKVVIAR